MIHNLYEARQFLSMLTEEEQYLHCQLDQIAGVDMYHPEEALRALMRILYSGTQLSPVGAPQCYDAMQAIAGKLMQAYSLMDSHRGFSWGTVSMGSGSDDMIRYSPSDFAARIQKLTAQAEEVEALSKEMKQTAASLVNTQKAEDMTITTEKMLEMSENLSELGGIIMGFVKCLTEISRNYATAQENSIAYALQIP